MTEKRSSDVIIMLGTYNGAAYIKQQLDSYQAQSFHNWELWCSDDGSADDTLAILTSFSQQESRPVNIVSGPRTGVCANFQSLIASPSIAGDYFAFSDQDDIWMQDKLARAVEWLEKQDPLQPALYCSRTQLIDDKNNPLGLSPDNSRPPSFRNALLQNLASGNTMVFNKCARDIMKSIAHLPWVIHDWALYLAVTGCGGRVWFDSQPSVLYRQHADNLIGNGMEVRTRLNNFVRTHRGNKVAWNDCHFRMLDALGDRLTPENRHSLDCFRRIRQSSWLGRMKLMRQSGIYHQKSIGALATWTYALFNRL